MTEILIENATLITMDPERRVIEKGWLAIEGARIAALGDADTPAPAAAQVIDGARMVVLPGLIDSHGHAGHALVKSLGAGDSARWFEACEIIYSRGSTAAF